MSRRPPPVKIVMSAAHGGFGSERVPLGGGAAVFERLCRSDAFAFPDLHLLGAGPHPPSRGRYSRLAALARAPSELGTFEYARFCRQFGDATTRKVLELAPDVLLSHDVSEGPDLAELSRAGIKVVTIFHVDVVDIFGRLYLRNLISPVRLARGYRLLRRAPWPPLLRLVFEKQEQVAEYGSLSVVPSSGAADLLERCYPDSEAAVMTVGWGVPAPSFGDEEVERAALDLRTRHAIPPDHRVLLTLSRLSPEKAQHRLLEAVRWAEEQGRMPADLTVAIAGAPAFMEGRRHARRLRGLAEKLRTRVVFPGHVGGLEKAAWYRTATLFVVNSLHESYGLTTLEAMQQGCPVVAVRSFGTADTVSTEVGRLVRPGPELAARLWGTVELMLDGDLERMGRRAKRYAREQSFEQAAQRLHDAIRRLA